MPLLVLCTIAVATQMEWISTRMRLLQWLKLMPLGSGIFHSVSYRFRSSIGKHNLDLVALLLLYLPADPLLVNVIW